VIRISLCKTVFRASLINVCLDLLSVTAIGDCCVLSRNQGRRSRRRAVGREAVAADSSSCDRQWWNAQRPPRSPSRAGYSSRAARGLCCGRDVGSFCRSTASSTTKVTLQTLVQMLSHGHAQMSLGNVRELNSGQLCRYNPGTCVQM
jgi:hypothetical protein